MRILYFYQYFSTPKGSWGTRAYDFSRRWVQEGHEVTVVTSVYDKSDLSPKSLISRFEVEGIEVIVINARLSNRHSLLVRLFTFALYAFWASWYALRVPADVVLASSGPLTVGLPALVAKYLRRLPLVFEVRDLLPEVAEELGLISNRFVLNATYLFVRRCYAAASVVVALSEGMAERLRGFYGVQRVVVIPNSANNALFGKTAFPGVPGLPEWTNGKDLALFTGTMGIANNCGLILDVAGLFSAEGEADILFVFIGDGKERQTLERRVEEENLENVRFIDPLPKHYLPLWCSEALCSLLTLRPVPVLDTSSPNKLFDSLAAGLPVIQTTQGWIKDLLAEEKCGMSVSGEIPREMAEAIKCLHGNPHLREGMRENAVQVARHRFDKEKLAMGMERVLRDALGSPGSAEEEVPREGSRGRSYYSGS